MDGPEDRVEGLSARGFLRSLLWLPWLCIVQMTYVIPRRFVAWVGASTTGTGVRYT